MNCVTCGRAVPSKYCPECGERRLDEHALSFGHFFEHAFEAFAHFDSTIIRSVKALAFAPGQLTADWARGRRRPYLAPVQLFLVMNVLFFIAQSLNGWNTLTTNLDVHLTWTAHQDVAKSMVKQRLAERKTTLQAYRPVFDAKAVIQAKSFVILMVPLLALLLALLSLGLGRYLVEHLVFSLHYYAFFLLYLSVSSSLATIVLLGLAKVGVRPGDGPIDQAVSAVMLLCLACYLTLAVRKVYRHGWFISLAKGVALCGASLYILYVYRFLLFLVTFRST